MKLIVISEEQILLRSITTGTVINPNIPTTHKMLTAMLLILPIQQVKSPRSTPTMLSVLRRISMRMIQMRSDIVVNITILKRVRFILGQGIITQPLVDLSAGTHSLEEDLIR